MYKFYIKTNDTEIGPFSAQEMAEKNLADLVQVREEAMGGTWFFANTYDFDELAQEEREMPKETSQNDAEKAPQFVMEDFIDDAERGLPEAQYRLALCYMNGEGAAHNAEKAFEWFAKAVEQGHADAQKWLGNCYSKGTGVQMDSAKAYEWFRKSAEQGNADAQNQLGCCYYNAEGVSQDYAEAVKWFQKAADQDEPNGMANLGMCYYNGVGVGKNYKTAVDWLTDAAERGIDYAQYYLGLCYLKGRGIKKDANQAATWFQKAADQGYEEAKNRTADLDKAFLNLRKWSWGGFVMPIIWGPCNGVYWPLAVLVLGIASVIIVPLMTVMMDDDGEIVAMISSFVSSFVAIATRIVLGIMGRRLSWDALQDQCDAKTFANRMRIWDNVALTIFIVQVVVFGFAFLLSDIMS